MSLILSRETVAHPIELSSVKFWEQPDRAEQRPHRLVRLSYREQPTRTYYAPFGKLRPRHLSDTGAPSGKPRVCQSCGWHESTPCHRAAEHTQTHIPLYRAEQVGRDSGFSAQAVTVAGGPAMKL